MEKIQSSKINFCKTHFSTSSSFYTSIFMSLFPVSNLSFFPTRNECIFTFSTLVSSVVLLGILFHSKFPIYTQSTDLSRVYRINYNLAPSLQNLIFYTRNECIFNLLHSFRVKSSTRTKMSSTRFECSFTSFPLVSSVVLHLLHSFRV